MSTRPLVPIAGVVLMLIASPAAAQPGIVPLCPGLRIVTAISQGEGDYESIKTIESVTDDLVRLRYASERTVQDLFSAAPPKLQQETIVRSVRRRDLASARLYLQQFSPELPETIPDTTAIGISTALLKTLKSKGKAEMGIFIPFTQVKPPLDRNVHPNVYDNQMLATVARASAKPVMLPIIVNDRLVDLPAIHVRGNFFGDESEFHFLEDEANPITLRFRIGIDRQALLAKTRLEQVGQKISPDRENLQVVRISYPCAAPTAITPGGGDSAATGLETALETARRADVYDISFSFNSDRIREESESTLKTIAAVLEKHAEWRLGIEGHTDNVASDAFNLDLSRRRAEAVRAVLIARYGIAGARLTAAGHGESRPRDTNDTLEGRAHNRRVELVRLP